MAGVNFWTEAVHECELQQAFELIEPALRVIARKSVEDWIPADVYMALKSGQYTLYLAYSHDELVGFYIATVNACEFSKKREFFVWCGYAEPRSHVLDEAMADIDRRALEFHCSRVAFGSGRAGWSRVLSRYNYRVKTVEYQKELNDGQ